MLREVSVIITLAKRVTEPMALGSILVTQVSHVPFTMTICT